MREKIFISLFFLLGSLSNAAQIDPVSPVKFKQENEYKILSFVKLDKPAEGKLKGFLDGKPCEVISTERPDSFLVWLPMIGDRAVLSINPTSTFPPQNFLVIQHLQFLHIYCGYYKFSNSTELG